MSYDALPFGTHCNCKKSRCLKLYCVCFMGGMYCNGCPCCECLNTVQHAETVQHERIKILRRSPKAFAPKVLADQASGDVAHKKGCRCKKSRCLKKYCECYDAGAPCSSMCKCVDCQNQADMGPSDQPDALMMGLRHSNREAAARMAGSGSLLSAPQYSNSYMDPAAGGQALVPGTAAHAISQYGMAQAAEARGAAGMQAGPSRSSNPYDLGGPTAAAGRRQRRPSTAMMDYETGEEHDDDQMAWQQQQQLYGGRQLPPSSSLQSLGPSHMTRRLEHTASFPPSRQEQDSPQFVPHGVSGYPQPPRPLTSQHLLGPTSDVLPALHGLESQPRAFPGGTLSTSSLGPLSVPLMDSGSLGGANTHETMVESWHMNPNKMAGKEPSASTARGPFAIAAGQRSAERYGQQQQQPPQYRPSPPGGPVAQTGMGSPHHDYQAAGLKRPASLRQPDPTPEMLLRPEVLLSDPDNAMLLASRLGGDATHMQAARKAANILKSMLDMARNSPAFLAGAPVDILRQQQPLPGVRPVAAQSPQQVAPQFQAAPALGVEVPLPAPAVVSEGGLPVAMSNMALHAPRGAVGGSTAWPGGSSDISSSGTASGSDKEGSSSDKDTGENAHGRTSHPDGAPSVAFQGLDVSGQGARPSGTGAPNRNSSSGGGAVLLGRGGNYHFAGPSAAPLLPPSHHPLPQQEVGHPHNLSAQASLTDVQLPPKRPRLVSDDATMTEGMVPSALQDMGSWGTPEHPYRQVGHQAMGSWGSPAHPCRQGRPSSAGEVAITPGEAEALQMLLEMQRSSSM